MAGMPGTEGSPGQLPRRAAEQRVLDWLARHQDSMVSDLRELLTIESVKAPGREGEPFGPGVTRALRWVQTRAEQLGLSTAWVDGYAVHAHAGPPAGPTGSGGLVGVLCHVDVVPAGVGWSVPPFSGEVRDGRVFGRGALDDKGPTVASLYAVAALANAAVPLSRPVRLIVGGDEESGFACLRYYFARHPRPEAAFSPDSLFPVVFAEKGILSLTLRRSGVEGPLRWARAGEQPNVVPDRAELELALPGEPPPESWLERLRAAAARRRARIELHPREAAPGSGQGPTVHMVAVGKATHGSVPEKGINAAAELLACVAEADGGTGRLDPAGCATFLARAGLEVYGRGLGIARQDDISGLLTCNLGVLRWEHGHIRAVFDIRYPVAERDAAGIVASAARTAGEAGFAVGDVQDDPPHSVDPDSPLVRTLLQVYREEAGDDLGPLAIGGGTYARLLPNAVGYGPSFPLRTAVIPHEPDEHISLEHLFQLARIYARALVALAA